MGLWNVGATTATKLHRVVELKAEFLNLKKEKGLIISSFEEKTHLL